MKNLRTVLRGLLSGLVLSATAEAATVSLTSPTNNQVFTAPASVSLKASTSGTGIKKVEFYQGTTLVGSDSTSPYSLTWSNAPAGSYSLTAKAKNSAGTVLATSSAVAIVVNAPPTVSLTSPTANQGFATGSSIALTATAADSDGSVSKVDFYRGTTLIGTATAAPYTVTWSNAAAGSYSLTAKATDNRGATKTSGAVAIVVAAAPTVTLTAPQANQLYTAPANVTLTATASPGSGATLTKVEFYQGSTLIGTATSTPYSMTWSNVPAGSYSLTAKATDSRNISTTSAAVPVSVDAAPSIAITSPANNQVMTAPANVTLTASAADGDGLVSKVDFYQGSTLIGTTNAAPYTLSWTPVPAGTYTLMAQATDNQGVVSTSSPVTLIVNGAPTISIVTPTAGQKYSAPASVTLTVTAADGDGSIASVAYFQNGTLLATVTSPPFSYTWSNVAQGSYSLTAQATDNRGTQTLSPAVSIGVDAAGPAQGMYFIHPDHLGTPRVITNEANQVVWRWDNDEPFGDNLANENPSGLGTFPFNLRFPGQYYDSETGTHYNYFRDYDPATGRYIQSDPIGAVLYEDLAAMSLAGSRGLARPELASQLYRAQPEFNHSYAFVNGQPTMAIDPEGLSADPLDQYTYPPTFNCTCTKNCMDNPDTKPAGLCKSLPGLKIVIKGIPLQLNPLKYWCEQQTKDQKCCSDCNDFCSGKSQVNPHPSK